MLNIVVRTDTPWRTMTYADFEKQSLNLPQRKATADVIKLWEDAYGLNYFLYRAAVREACEAELGYVAGVISKVQPIGEVEIVIPIDDDDVLFPEVETIVPLFDNPAVNVVTWNRQTIVHGEPRLERTGLYLDTCNWAIRRSWLDSFHPIEREMMLQKHQRAHKYVGQRLGLLPRIFGKIGQVDPIPSKVKLIHPSVQNVGQSFSAYYLHSGSISFLAHWMKTPSELRTLPLHPLFNRNVYDRIAA